MTSRASAGYAPVLEAGMTKESLAATLDGRQYRNEIAVAEAHEAKLAGLVVLYGASDDLAEFEGAISEERDCYGGDEFLLVDGRLFEDDGCTCKAAVAAHEAAEDRGKKIKAEWCKGEGYPWTYSTDIPHATFDVMEGGEKYCRGIVFALADAR